MASQNLNVGTGANANDGDTLRAAFIKVRKMFAEVYGQTYVDDTTEIPSADFKIDASRMETTNTPASGLDGYVMTYDHSSGGFTFEEYFNGDITRVQGGSGLSGDTQSGDATISIDLNDLTEAALDVANDDIAFVDTSDSNTTRKESIADIMTAVAGSGLTATSGVLSVDSIGTDGIADDAVTAAKLALFDDSAVATTTGDLLISDGTDFSNVTMIGDATINSGGVLTIGNDKITHDKLEGRYTAVQTIGTTTATVNLDASLYSVFNITANLQSTQTLNLQNMKTGQVIDILATGTSTLTLTSDDTSETFNNLGEVTYDGSSNNHIQIVCIDDTDSAAIYNYTIQTYTSDNTPN